MSWVRVPDWPCAFSSPVTFGGSVWVRARAASSKGTVSSVPAWYRADSGTNLIKQGEIVTGRLCGSVAQWSESSHGVREVLGSSPGRAMSFFLHCDIKVNKATGPYRISHRMLRQSSKTISLPLCKLFNLSLKTNTQLSGKSHM